jgi:hypothetical protein
MREDSCQPIRNPGMGWAWWRCGKLESPRMLTTSSSTDGPALCRVPRPVQRQIKDWVRFQYVQQHADVQA